MGQTALDFGGPAGLPDFAGRVRQTALVVIVSALPALPVAATPLAVRLVSSIWGGLLWHCQSGLIAGGVTGGAGRAQYANLIVLVILPGDCEGACGGAHTRG